MYTYTVTFNARSKVLLTIPSSFFITGLTNNQFGLIGFGGDSIHNTEHTHTIGGQTLGSAKDFKLAINNLLFNKEGENTDVFKVVLLIHYMFCRCVPTVVFHF